MARLTSGVAERQKQSCFSRLTGDDIRGAPVPAIQYGAPVFEPVCYARYEDVIFDNNSIIFPNHGLKSVKPVTNRRRDVR